MIRTRFVRLDTHGWCHVHQRLTVTGEHTHPSGDECCDMFDPDDLDTGPCGICTVYADVPA